MENEFDEIEKQNLWLQLFNEIREESGNYEYTCKDGKLSDNKLLNRYRDVIPYDHSRVHLKRLPNDYINASLVLVDNADRAYILTQGPLQHTVSHFWLMIWEQGSTAILMLNRLMEKGQIKCHQYWPNGSVNNHIDTLEFDDVSLRVDYKSEVDCKHFIVRHFLLTDLESGQTREIKHFNYTSWPDFGLPESPSSFLDLLKAVRDVKALDDVKSPPVIHCSAGIGRSGTFCLVDTCLVLLENYIDQKKTIKEILLDMRKYRTGLIQTPDQLRFSYMVVKEGAKTLKSTNSQSKTQSSITSLITEKYRNELKIDNNHYINDNSVLFNENEHNKTLPLSLPKTRKSFSSNNQSSPSSSSNTMTTVINDKSNELISSMNNDNNNIIPSSSELRKRFREERNRKTQENIKRIKDKQKEIEERSRSRKLFIKYAKISVGIAFVFGAGFVLYNNYISQTPLPEINVS